MDKIKCPFCGELENFNINDNFEDDSIIEIELLCNECGGIFFINQSDDK